MTGTAPGDLSHEQKAVVNAPLRPPLSVIACAGSGKTRTAVHRVAATRSLIGEHRGHVLLLSFSNVAVGTFAKAYFELGSRSLRNSFASRRVQVETFDSFLSANVLRPHAGRTMGCPRTPFLVSGSEAFLQNPRFCFKVARASGTSYPISGDQLGDVVVVREAGALAFRLRWHNSLLEIPNGPSVVRNLGAIGAYTHALGQYLAHETLVRQPRVLDALARRFPHVVVDEAQDVGAMHGAILSLLSSRGVQVSLVGDPSQAIYEFAGADGELLKTHRSERGAVSYELQTNFRSVASIVSAANALAGRADHSDRGDGTIDQGTRFIGYRDGQFPRLLSLFQDGLKLAGASVKSSAVLARSRELVRKIAGGGEPVGQGLIKSFAEATTRRDARGDYLEAFNLVVSCVIGMLKQPAPDLFSKLSRPQGDELRDVRREIWAFTRDPDNGLPGGRQFADTEWHPALVRNLKAMLLRLRAFAGFEFSELGQRLARRNVPHEYLTTASRSVSDGLRISTVHQAKGESLEAVLYVAEKKHVDGLLSGVNEELGRIGYVALTRAMNLFWLAVPELMLAKARGPLGALGFREMNLDLTAG